MGREGGRIIVTLTTFPARIHQVWAVIETIFRQTCQPDKVVLWLSKEEFSSLDALPARLLKQTNCGLEIRFCESNLGPHKKYLYSIKEFPSDLVVTVDDDILYPATMIEELISAHHLFPTAICCHRASRISSDNRGLLLPYLSWPAINGAAGPSRDIFFTSGGGTLFPPGVLHVDVLNVNGIVKCSPYADDVWLNAMARLNNTLVLKTTHNGMFPMWNYSGISLYNRNVLSEGNDKQIVATANYCERKFGTNPFKVCSAHNE